MDKNGFIRDMLEQGLADNQSVRSRLGVLYETLPAGEITRQQLMGYATAFSSGYDAGTAFERMNVRDVVYDALRKAIGGSPDIPKAVRDATRHRRKDFAAICRDNLSPADTNPNRPIRAPRSKTRQR